MEKPMSMKIVEFKNNLVKIINDSQLPPFIIEPVIKDAYELVVKANEQLLQQDSIKYKQELENKKEEVKEQ